MKKPVLKAISKELQRARYVAQLEHSVLWYQSQSDELSAENAELRALVEYQLAVLANAAAQNAELTRQHAEALAGAYMEQRV
jgi:hypothetical protein